MTSIETPSIGAVCTKRTNMATNNFVIINVNGERGSYVAQLTGLDRKFGFVRDFCGRSAVVTGPGVYEDVDTDRKGRKDVGYYFVFRSPISGSLRKTRADKIDVIKLFAAGMNVEQLTFEFIPDEPGSKVGKWSFQFPTT